jgi:hypothetical protein
MSRNKRLFLILGLILKDIYKTHIKA